MKRKVPWIPLAIAVLASLFWIAIGSTVVAKAKTYDFLSAYTAGMLARQGNFARLYDADLQYRVQKQAAPDAPIRIFVIRPPIFALMTAPFALLPFTPSFWLWIGSQIAALLAFWVWAARRFGSDALVYCAFFLPAATGLMNGQDNVWMMAVVSLAYLLRERGQPIAAGAVLAIGLVKFHLLLLLPLAIAVAGEWRLLAGFSMAGAGEAILSLALVGWSGFQRYWALLH
ncbi:MAG: glycosyltransferase family 87 protein, partial [Gammaproteobacteria bacterium]